MTKKDDICKICKIYEKASLKDQLWKWKMTDKACKKDWFKTISSAIKTCQEKNIEACIKNSQKYQNSEWEILWWLQDLHTCAENESAESWICEACQWADKKISHKFYYIMSV